MRFNRKAMPITSRALFTIVGGAVLINPVFAQEQSADELEEVVVTGLRGSLKASMEIKREATGVVDAISAEDIGSSRTPTSPSHCNESPAYPSTV